jgi:tRNA (mo5U34)-methyltransferase
MTDFAHETQDQSALKEQIEALGQWFHNLDLHGVPTAPGHFLGDFPQVKWQHIAASIPEDLRGATVLDVGCNGGFYSIQMKRRGADRVLGVDIDDRYLNQAKFAAETLALDLEFERCSVYELDQVEGQFDYVLFMGVFYHLRYPLYALDTVAKKVRGTLIFQTMIRGSEHAKPWAHDYPFSEREIFREPDFPAMYFVEHRYSHDPTNWWIPNSGAVEAMLRSSGFKIVGHPEAETWICVPDTVRRRGSFVRELELDGQLPVEDQEHHDRSSNDLERTK